MGLTKDQQNAFDFMDSGANVFLTGKAGTGKSYLLEYIYTCFFETERNYFSLLKFLSNILKTCSNILTILLILSDVL